MIDTYFDIAKHIVRLSMPDGWMWETMLPSFRPFHVASSPDGQWMCALVVKTEKPAANLTNAKLLAEERQVLGDSLRLYRLGEGGYVADLRIDPNGETFRMMCNETFDEVQAYIGEAGGQSIDALRGFLMFTFAQAAVLHRTAMIHASVVMKEGKGYAFLGKSGTGKSTHSVQWLKVFRDAELLNDDNPAVRLEDDGQVYIYGTPWSGKTPCYKQIGVPWEAYVRLEQAPLNAFARETGTEAFVSLLPSCSAMRWNSRLYTALCDLVEECSARVKAGSLKCLPNEDAARVCYKGLNE
ncbi:MAG: phosphoenolpyruvate carboxykinase [Mediterranea sp.]|jgi:hypothetical protein|nr:phosphoenolpyruvate carboxykinase [Mediterranea sp.]